MSFVSKKRSKLAKKEIQNQVDSAKLLLPAYTQTTNACDHSICYRVSASQVSQALDPFVRKAIRAARAVAGIAKKSCSINLSKELKKIDQQMASLNAELSKVTLDYCVAKGESLSVPVNGATVLYGSSDSDQDYLTDVQEFLLGSNVAMSDSDSDGVSDDREDSDGDGVSNAQELAQRSNPLSASSPVSNGAADTDGDTLSNALELASGLNPDSRDSDGDGVDDKRDLFGLANNEKEGFSVAGIAPEGSTISVNLLRSGQSIGTGSVAANSSGQWEVPIVVSSSGFEVVLGVPNVQSPTDDQVRSYRYSISSFADNPAAPTATFVTSAEVPATEADSFYLYRLDAFNSKSWPAAVRLDDGNLAIATTLEPDGVTESRNETDDLL